MKKKTILLHIATVTLAVFALAFGVFALLVTNFSLRGSIGFIPNNCIVEVYGTITGAVSDPKSEDTSEVFYIGNEENKITIQGNRTLSFDKYLTHEDLGDTYPQIFFNDLGSSTPNIVITLNVTNKTEYAISAQVSTLTTGTAAILATETQKISTIEPEANATAQVTLSLVSAAEDFSVTDNFSMVITFDKVGAESSTEPNLDNETPSQGIVYTEIYDGDTLMGYEASDFTACTDTNIIIPAEYGNKPVLRVKLVEVDSGSQGIFGSGTKYLTNQNTESIYIPSSVTSIIADGYFVVGMVGAYIVSPNNAAYSSKDGVLYNKYKTELISYPLLKDDAEFTVPASVEKINGGAFGLRNYLFGLQDLGITMPGITVPETFTETAVKFETNSRLTEVADAAFSGSAISEITFPSSLKKFGSSQFMYSSVKKVFFEEGTTFSNLGDYIFTSAIYLNETNILKYINEVPYAMFEGASMMASTASIDIPDNVTKIGESSFKESGATVNISSSIKVIDRYAFYNCKTQPVVDLSNVETIGEFAFYECTTLTSVTFGTHLRSIGYQAFRDCTNLEVDLVFYEGLEIIEEQAFDGCKITSLSALPDSLKFIGDQKFLSISNRSILPIYEDTANHIIYLKSKTNNYFAVLDVTQDDSSYNINENTKIICADAFLLNEKLTSISLPEGLLSIGRCAFYECGLVGNLKLPESLYIIGPQAFDLCAGITSIDFPSNLYRIDAYAFENCTGLIGPLVLPSNLYSVGWRAFANCSKLTGDLNIPYIEGGYGEAAFRECSGLNGTVTFMDGITEIPASFFKDCSNIKEVVCASSVKSFSVDVFSGCNSLTTITFKSSTMVVYDYPGSFSLPSSVTKIYIAKGTLQDYVQDEYWSQIDSSLFEEVDFN